MSIGDAVAIRIEELCSAKGITINKLATISGITQSTLDHVVNGEHRNPTVSTIKKICDGLEIRISDFFDTDLFHNLEQELK